MTLGQIVVPLIINSEHVILSGHRRWGAAKELGLEVVPCEIRDFESSEDELEFLLHSNVTRKKSKEQLAREGIALEEVLSVQASKRRNENLKQFQSVMDESSTTDDVNDNMDSLMEDDDANKTAMKLTRDAVANALKIGSGKQFDKMKAVIKKVDELKELGKTEYAELFLIALNRSASAAYDLISVPLDSLTDDDKDNIRAGKVAPRQFLPEQTSSKHKKDSPYKKVTDEISSIQKCRARGSEDGRVEKNPTSEYKRSDFSLIATPKVKAPPA